MEATKSAFQLGKITNMFLAPIDRVWIEGILFGHASYYAFHSQQGVSLMPNPLSSSAAAKRRKDVGKSAGKAFGAAGKEVRKGVESVGNKAGRLMKELAAKDWSRKEYDKKHDPRGGRLDLNQKK